MDWAVGASERGEAAAGIEQALGSWRQAHPRATLDEIVAAVDTELARVRRQYIEDLAHATPPETGTAERAICPACGDRMGRRGQRKREVLVPGHGAPVRLERTYQVCPTCGLGLFPPR